MSISNFISKVIHGRSLESRAAQNGAQPQDTYICPSIANPGYSSSIWVRDYNCGVYLRVPV